MKLCIHSIHTKDLNFSPACATEDMLDEEQWHLALNPQQPGAPSGAEQQQRSNANRRSKPGQPKPTKPSWFALIMEFLFLVAVCVLVRTTYSDRHFLINCRRNDGKPLDDTHRSLRPT